MWHISQDCEYACYSFYKSFCLCFAICLCLGFCPFLSLVCYWLCSSVLFGSWFVAFIYPLCVTDCQKFSLLVFAVFYVLCSIFTLFWPMLILSCLTCLLGRHYCISPVYPCPALNSVLLRPITHTWFLPLSPTFVILRHIRGWSDDIKLWMYQHFLQ